MRRAASLAENVLHDHAEKLDAVSLIPSSGGVFEVSLGGELIFSKKEQGRFPEDGEIISRIEAS